MNKPPRLDLNPSSADRWTTCTASPQFILENADKLPLSGSRFADDGTTAHAVAAALLLNQPEPKDTPTPVDSDMRWHGWNYAEYVQSLQQPQSMLFVEQKMELWYMPGRHAITDAAVINPLNMHVVDYKYGEGIAIHPEGNLQAVIYAYSTGKAHALPDDFPVFIHIYQPRGRNSAGQPEKVWETSWGTISNIAEKIQTTASVIQEVGSQPSIFVFFEPSEKACQWCPAKGFCEARRATLLDGIEALAAIEDAAPTLPVKSTLPDEQISAVLKHADAIRQWIAGIEEYALQRMNAGYSYPGFKLVMSKGGHRYWTDGEKAKKLLLETHLRRNEVVKESVISPKQAEDLLGKRKFGVELVNLIGKPPGHPEIAAEGDKREAIGQDALADFEAIP